MSLVEGKSCAKSSWFNSIDTSGSHEACKRSASPIAHRLLGSKSPDPGLGRRSERSHQEDPNSSNGFEKIAYWDRGLEMAGQQKLSVATGVEVYLCDPQSPWQRCSNENTNRLLRWYLRKGTDLSVHSQRQLDAISRKLNTRPRKTPTGRPLLLDSTNCCVDGLSSQCRASRFPLPASPFSLAVDSMSG